MPTPSLALLAAARRELVLDVAGGRGGGVARTSRRGRCAIVAVTFRRSAANVAVTLFPRAA